MKTKYIIFLIALFVAKMAFSQGVSINLNNEPPDSSAMLDITATDKGILIPRLTKTQRDDINNPKQGLLVFQTDNTAGLYFYTGTQWENVNIKSSDWIELGGNVYRQNGFVGIGTQFPSNNLTVADYDETTIIEIQTDGFTENAFTRLSLKTNQTKGWHFTATGSEAPLSERDQFSLRYFNGDEWKNPIAFDTLANVGFGTTHPTEKIHVEGNIFLTGEILTDLNKYKNQNFSAVENSLEKILKLNPVLYNKSGNYGFLLNDLKIQFPELLKTNREGVEVINYNQFTPILIKALQEQNSEIEKLKSEKNELKDRLKKIEQQLEILIDDK